jgi:transposase
VSARSGGAFAVEKERLVAASLEPGASVSLVARQAGMHPSQLYGWRRQLVRQSQPRASFAAVRIAGEPTPAGGLIEIELANGSRVRISGPADAGLVQSHYGSCCQAGSAAMIQVVEFINSEPHQLTYRITQAN